MPAGVVKAAVSDRNTMSSLANKHILLGVTGGIAAYKSADLIRRLQDLGAEVRVVMRRKRGRKRDSFPIAMSLGSGIRKISARNSGMFSMDAST